MRCLSQCSSRGTTAMLASTAHVGKEANLLDYVADMPPQVCLGDRVDVLAIDA